MINFLLLFFLFLGSLMATQFLLVWGRLSWFKLKSLAPSPGRWNLSKRCKCLLFFFQTPFCSGLHRNLLHCKWQPPNHHLEVWGELRMSISSCRIRVLLFGVEEISERGSPSLKDLCPLTEDREHKQKLSLLSSSCFLSFVGKHGKANRWNVWG